MAQVLKEQQRQRILDAATSELLEKGYRDASMRRIAAKAHMTAGNLYRYFKSKDDLIQFIVNPVVDQLDRIIQDKTLQRISLYRNAEKIGFSREELAAILDSLAEDLAELYASNEKEMRILMLHSEVSKTISVWFTQLIQVLAAEMFSLASMDEKNIYLISRMMAASIFNGLQECFRMSEETADSIIRLKQLIRIYFRCFISMTNMDMKMMKGALA